MFAQFGGADDVSGGVLHEGNVLQGEINYFSIAVADCQRPVPNFLTDTNGSPDNSCNSSSLLADVDKFASIFAHVYSAAGIHQQPGQLSGDIHVRSRGAYFAGINVLHPVNVHSQRMGAMSGLNPSQSSSAPFVAAPVVLGIVWTCFVWHPF